MSKVFKIVDGWGNVVGSMRLTGGNPNSCLFAIFVVIMLIAGIQMVVSDYLEEARSPHYTDLCDRVEILVKTKTVFAKDKDPNDDYRIRLSIRLSINGKEYQWKDYHGEGKWIWLTEPVKDVRLLWVGEEIESPNPKHKKRTPTPIVTGKDCNRQIYP